MIFGSPDCKKSFWERREKKSNREKKKRTRPEKSVDTPVLFDTVGAWALPEIVEGVEENDVVTAGGFDGADGSRLLGRGGNSDTVVTTLVRPAGFDTHDALTTDRGNSLHLLQ